MNTLSIKYMHTIGYPGDLDVNVPWKIGCDDIFS